MSAFISKTSIPLLVYISTQLFIVLAPAAITALITTVWYVIVFVSVLSVTAFTVTLYFNLCPLRCIAFPCRRTIHRAATSMPAVCYLSVPLTAGHHALPFFCCRVTFIFIVVGIIMANLVVGRDIYYILRYNSVVVVNVFVVVDFCFCNVFVVVVKFVVVKFCSLLLLLL